MSNLTIGRDAPVALTPIALPEPHRWARVGQLAKRGRIQLASLVVFLGVWQLVGARTNPVLFATPWKVVRAFFDLAGNGQLGSALGTAAGDFLAGFFLSIVVGIGIGLAMGQSSIVSRTISPYVNFMQATPVLALVPLMIIWFGIGFGARVVVVFMFGVWTMIISTETGVKATPRAFMEVAEIYHFSAWRKLRDLTLPNAVPLIFAGLRIALAKCLIGMIIAEMDVTVTGLGGLIANYGESFETADLLAGVLAAAIFGAVTAGLLSWSMGHFFPWVRATTSPTQEA